MKQVRVCLGRFQPFTLGHLKMATYKDLKGPKDIQGYRGIVKQSELLREQPDLDEISKQKTIILAIYTSKDKVDKKHPFDVDLIKKELEIVRKNYPEIEDVMYVPSADICLWGEMLKKAGYQASVWITGSDEAKGYVEMAMKVPDYEVKNRDNRDCKGAYTKSFYVESIERTDDSDFVSSISGTKVREALINNDMSYFRKAMPKGTDHLFDEMKEAVVNAPEVVKTKKTKVLKEYIKDKANICNNLMKGITEYINEKHNIILTKSHDDKLKLSHDDKIKLIELDVKFDSILKEYEREHLHFANVKNTKEEIDKIIKCRKEKKDWEINIEYENSKFSDDNWCNDTINRLQELKNEFITLDCYLTKFYRYRIERTIESIIFFKEYSKHKTFPLLIDRPSEKLYINAIDTLKKNKYVDVYSLKDKKYERNFTPEESQKRLQKIIDNLGYGWKVIIDDNMIPRMSVTSYREFRISANNKFSEVDLQSLEVHEIKVHVARKYYALQTGLYLFIYGLRGSNVYDEGMAIYNSLNKTKTPKPNILFYIAIKIVILYNLNIMPINELFDFIKSITNAPDETIALALIRASRVFSYTSIYTDSLDQDYFKGYMLVKDMTEEQREELLKLTVGPEQLYEIPTIKKFLKVNKFEPISINNEKNVKKLEIY